MLRKLLLTGLMGTALVMGCSHFRHGRDCDCECTSCCSSCSSTTVTPVAALPSVPQQLPMAEAPKTDIAHVAYKAEAPPVPVKKPEASREMITFPVVAPGMDYNSASVTGTVEMNAAEAASMGIRPGYSPGALYQPNVYPSH